jgi:hypothetical protein
VSVTVMIWLQLELLPQLSVAVQVRVMTWLPAQLPAAVTSLWVMEATPLQSSVAVAVPVLAASVEAVQSIVLLAGQVIVGACVSVTVMVCVQLEALPQLSVAVQIRVMT